MPEFKRLTLCYCIILCCLSGPVVAQEPVREPAKKRWIIDPHTHFKGAEQIEWETRTNKRHPKNTLGHVITPEDYRSVADRLGIQSTVVVEAVEQATPQFNDWLLEQAKSDLISGYVARGNLLSPEFADNYEQYKSSGYLRGFRFRQAELRGYLDHETARQHLQRLERDGMVVDLLVNSDHAESVMALAREFPELTIVIDHCFGARLVSGEVSPEWTKAVNDCSQFPNVHCKLSSILNFSDAAPFGQPASVDLETYQPILETCFRAFGEDRVMFATNWAVCSHYGQVDDVVSIVTEFLTSKGERALQKGMRENALRVFQIREEHLRPREKK